MELIHISKNGVELGSFTLEAAQNGMIAGRFSRNDWAWVPPMEKWRPLGELVDEMQERFDSMRALTKTGSMASMANRIGTKIGPDGRVIVPKPKEEKVTKSKTVFFGRLGF
jgi:hypothetical protein